MTAAPIRIGLVAGEASGDQLGAALMRGLRRRYPAARFEGLGGPRMIAEGFHSLFPLERVAVMGLVEPLKRLPELLRIRRQLRRHFLRWQPAVTVGIDAPDFNLGLELALRGAGLRTVHYVSPSVWAWRSGRIRKIARAVDLMLTLLPFEADFYRAHGVPVAFVGHPLADEMPLRPDTQAARRRLGLPAAGPVIALLPGSRGGEVAMLAPLFIEVARRCRQDYPGLACVLPAASAERREQIERLLATAKGPPLTLVEGQSHLAMAAADVVLLASGTAALEAMLLKKPMVVAYKVGWLTHRLLAPLVKTPFVSLPNLLAGRALVPELLQREATVANLADAVLGYLRTPAAGAALYAEFQRLHEALRGGDAAAAAVAGLIAQAR